MRDRTSVRDNLCHVETSHPQKMAGTVGNDPTYEVFQTSANPSQLCSDKLVRGVGLEPTQSDSQSETSTLRLPSVIKIVQGLYTFSLDFLLLIPDQLSATQHAIL